MEDGNGGKGTEIGRQHYVSKIRTREERVRDGMETECDQDRSGESKKSWVDVTGPIEHTFV